MSEQLKLRGDTATNLASFTPAQRECVVDITNNRLCVGDGSTANGWPLAKLSEGAWTVSTGVMQCVLSQRTAITSEPVPTLRPTTANTPIALDIMPNGSPGGTGIAWHDICDADVLNNTSTPVNFLHLAANSTTLEVGSASLYGGTGKPLIFTYGGTEKFRLNANGLGIGVGSNAYVASLTVSNNTAALPTPPNGTVLVLGAADTKTTFLQLYSFGNNGEIDFRTAGGTCASPSALSSGATMGQFNSFGYNGSTYQITASLTFSASENWTGGANGTYMSFYATPNGTTSITEVLRALGTQIEFKVAQADQSKVDDVPVTGFSWTIGNNCSTLLLKPAGTLATGTVIMPAAPVDGQIARVLSSQTITSLTVSPSSGQAVVGAPSTIGPSAPFSMIYDLASTTWYRT
jgi:Major tropism determinant N-terminal domain